MRSPGLIGPLAGWELRRLARRGLALRVWVSLLYLLVLVFVVFAAFWFYPRSIGESFLALLHLTPTEGDRFADRFALVLLEVQLVAIIALTPALAASAVAEEKDRHTLPLLLTTSLTDREIVLGKAAGRIAFMIVAITASVPLLALTLSIGRVSSRFLILGYSLTFSTIALCASIALEAACRAPDFRSTLLRAYGRVAILVGGAFVPPCVLASPVGLLEYLHSQSSLATWPILIGCGYVLLQLFVGLLFLSSAARSLRLRDAATAPPLRSAFPLPPRPARPPLIPPLPVTRSPLPPPDSADPVLWKERCVAWQPNWAMPTVAKGLGLLAAAATLLLFARGTWTALDRVRKVFDPAESLTRRLDAPPDDAGWLLTAAGIFAAGRYLLPLTVGLSGAVAGERLRGTLDALLATPLERRAILRAKAQAHAERGTAFAAIATAAVGMGFTSDGDIRLGTSAAALMLGGVALVIGVGAWLTVRCVTDVRAFRMLLPVTLLAAGWPIGAWSYLRFDTELPREVLTRTMIIAALVSAIAGAVFWRLAEWKLERGE